MARSSILLVALIGACLAFAPGLPTNRPTCSVAFIPPRFRSLATTKDADTIVVDDDDYEDDTGEEEWNAITPKLRTAGDNFCRITGVHSLEIQTLFQTLQEYDEVRKMTYVRPRFFKKCIDMLLPWHSISRGTDLFIPQMGSFDIEKVYQRAVEPNRRQFRRRFYGISTLPNDTISNSSWANDDASNVTARKIVLNRALEHPTEGPKLRHDMGWEERDHRMSNYMAAKEQIMSFPLGVVMIHRDDLRPYWLVSPLELQVRGYFGERLNDNGEELDDLLDDDGMWANMDHNRVEFLLSQSEDYPQRRYLIKFYQDYFKTHRYQGYLDELIRCGDRRPDWFDYTEDQERDEMYGQVWPPDQPFDAMPPPPQLFRGLVRLRQERNRRERLGENEVYEHLYGLQDKEIGKIRLIVVRSKYDLHQVGEDMQNCAFDYAPALQSGQSILIKAETAESNRPIALGLYDLYQDRWDQMYGPRNEPVEDSIRKAYENYTPTLLEWSRFVKPLEL